ncbi:MAG: signal recognition particle-docking protein FtsY, partial [Bifidobacterium sp.]|nr:signal recognition particle-docking protein FtsY [Bifidobacterium sp.]
MDTNMVYGIIAVVVIAALLIAGFAWADHSRKNTIAKSQSAAKAKADARLAAERRAAQSAQPPASASEEEEERRKAET